LGLVYKIMKRQDDALKSYRKALELNPLQMDALELMVNNYVRDKKFKEALTITGKTKKKISDHPTEMAYIENMEGKIFMAKGDPKKAEQHFKKAVEYNPTTLPPRVALAGIHAREKKMSLAISDYEDILKINPEYLPACMALGTIYDRQGEKEKAEKYYRKALKIKGDFAPAANNLAFILAEKGGNISEALRLAQLARQNMPKDANVMDPLGWIFYLQGTYDKAISEFKESLALNPDSAIANYHLGLALYETDEFEKAREHMKKALKLDPNFEGADKARSMLDE